MAPLDDVKKKLEREIATFIFSKSQENLIEEGAIDTGNLLLSGKVLEEGGKIYIYYDAPYAWDVNNGAEPHFVNPEELKGWVKRKLGKTNIKEINKIAFAISKKIAERGTKPQPFMSNAIHEGEFKYNLKVEY